MAIKAPAPPISPQWEKVCEDLSAKIEQCSRALVDAQSALTNATLAAELDPAAGDEVVRARERVELFRSRRPELEAALIEAQRRAAQQAEEKENARRALLAERGLLHLQIRDNHEVIITKLLHQLAVTIEQWRAEGERAIQLIKELNRGQHLAFGGIAYDNDCIALRLAVLGASGFMAKMFEVEPDIRPDKWDDMHLQTQRGRRVSHGWLTEQLRKARPESGPIQTRIPSPNPLLRQTQRRSRSPALRQERLRRMRRERESKVDRLKRECREETAYIVASEVGRRFAWRLLCETGAIATSTASDPSQAAFAEGRRSVGVESLGAVLAENRQALALLLTENLTADRRERSAVEPDADNDDADPAEHHREEQPDVDI